MKAFHLDDKSVEGAVVHNVIGG
ncbi:TPA_asm: UL9.4 dORF [Human alphaherpesvirus 1]|nr:TPA_asm: UL9.4 dORF [Human alphaherpesvirus 1]